jgi:hypothetical protein
MEHMTLNIKKGKGKGKGKGPKYSKRGIEASSSGHKRKHEKRNDKKGKSMNYFNCDKADHFAHDCCRTCAASRRYRPLLGVSI